MEKMFECVKCGEFDNLEEWMKATREDVIQDGKNGDNIPELTPKMIDNKECYYYICPNCGETCYVEDGHIKVVE